MGYLRVDRQSSPAPGSRFGAPLAALLFLPLASACTTTANDQPADFEEAQTELSQAGDDKDVERLLPKTLERANQTYAEAEKLLRLSKDQHDSAARQYYLQRSILRANEAELLATQARDLAAHIGEWDKHIEQYADERRHDQLIGLAAGEMEDTEACPVPSGGDLSAISFSSDLAFFDAGTDELRDQDMPKIASLAELLQAEPSLKVKVVGYSDGTGDSAANASLALRRAKEVAGALAETGVAPDRITMESLGDTDAGDAGETAEQRQLDRRVEVYVSGDSGPEAEAAGFAH